MTARHHPRSRFSQNFLRDRNTIERLVAAIDPRPSQRLVEIGPGEGALTRPLLAHAGALTAIEVDADLADRLADWPGLVIERADSRQIDLTALAQAKGGALRLVGNLPYHITTPLVFHALAHCGVITDMHFLLQAEVVQRLAASAGSRDYGRLSVMVQYRCRVEPLFRVPPGAFRPAPRVTSQLVRLTPHAQAPVSVRHEAALETTVAYAFGQRRKTLRNALRPLLDAAAISAAGVSPGERAEQLSLADFAALADAYYARQSGELS